jgi:hypothetical protein
MKRPVRERLYLGASVNAYQPRRERLINFALGYLAQSLQHAIGFIFFATVFRPRPGLGIVVTTRNISFAGQRQRRFTGQQVVGRVATKPDCTYLLPS